MLRDNVVSITADRPSGQHDGFGIIAGEREGRVHIVTANHIVRGDNPGDTAMHVTVRYYHSRNDAYEAKLLGASDSTYDLAVLEAPAPSGLEWHRAALRSNPGLSRGTPLWFIGRAGDWYIPTQPGRLNSVTLDFRVRVDGLNVQVGTSGAPLLADDGIIGMMVQDEAAGVSGALAIDIIERAFRLWDLPWDLKPLLARVAIPDLSPEAEMHLAAGNRFLETDQYTRAIEEYQSAAEYDRRNTAVLYGIVTAMRLELWRAAGIPMELVPAVTERQDYNELASYADRALQLLYQAQGIDPSLKSSKDWILEEAYIRRGRGDWSLAVEALERAREIVLDEPDVQSELGLLLTHFMFESRDIKEQYTEGVALLRAAVAAQPQDPLYRRHLASGLAPSDEPAAVHEFFEAAKLSTADSAPSILNRRGALQDLAQILMRWGWLEYVPGPDTELSIAELIEALEYFKEHSNSRDLQAIRYSPDWLQFLLATVYFQLDRLADAEHLIRKMTPESIDESLTHRNMDRDVTGPSLILLARILQQRASDPATLLALQLYMGGPNILGAIVRNMSADGPLIVEALIDEELARGIGLEVDDRIWEVDGEDATLETLGRAVADKQEGELIELAAGSSPEKARLLKVVTQPVRNGPSGFLGFMFAETDLPWQIKVAEVVEDGPAQRAGIRPGDLIRSVYGIPLFGWQHLLYMLAGLRPGVTVPIEILRDEADILTLTATLAERRE